VTMALYPIIRQFTSLACSSVIAWPPATVAALQARAPPATAAMAVRTIDIKHLCSVINNIFANVRRQEAMRYATGLGDMLAQILAGCVLVPVNQPTDVASRGLTYRIKNISGTKNEASASLIPGSHSLVDRTFGTPVQLGSVPCKASGQPPCAESRAKRFDHVTSNCTT
jgi:hypothetical protein